MKSNTVSELGLVLLLLLCTFLYHTESALPSQQTSITEWRTKMVRVTHSSSPPSPHYYVYKSPPPPPQIARASPPPPQTSHATPPRIPNVPSLLPGMPHTPP